MLSKTNRLLYDLRPLPKFSLQSQQGGELPIWQGRQGVGLLFEHCRLEVMNLINTILLIK